MLENVLLFTKLFMSENACSLNISESYALQSILTDN